mgnify:CR=1 FL=1
MRRRVNGPEFFQDSARAVAKPGPLLPLLQGLPPRRGQAAHQYVRLDSDGVPTGKGPGAGIDQNRFFLGINKSFSQYFNVDLGYQNQMINSRQLPGNANLINHIFLLQFFINL